MNLQLQKDLGTLYVDCGDVVCLSVDAIYKIMAELKIADVEIDHDIIEKKDEFIKKIGGIACNFHCDGKYAVIQGIDEQGCDIVTIHEYSWG